MKIKKSATTVSLIVLMAYTSTPPVAAQTIPPEVSTLAQYTAQGVVKSVAGELTSWGMASLGFPSTNSTAELASLLKKVVEELADIDALVSDLDCIANATDAQEAANRIQSAWNTYQVSVQDSFINETTLDDWIKYVRGTGEDSLTDDIILISNDFRGLGSGVSILSSCESANGVVAPKENTLGDLNVWEFSTNLINYYASWAIVGIAMLADDSHLQAYTFWLDEGNTANSVETDDIPVTVCGSPPTNTPRAGACLSAQTLYTTYRNNYVALLLTYGGAPYSSNEQAILNGHGTLWVPDLNDFIMAGGYSSTCASATSATTPCGAGVGGATLSVFSDYDGNANYPYGGWGTVIPDWVVADTNAWTNLLAKFNSGVLRDWLVNLGFKSEGVANRIFYTGETLSVNDKLEKQFQDGDAIFRMYEYACFVLPEANHEIESAGGVIQPYCSDFNFRNSLSLDKTHKSSGDKNECATILIPDNLIANAESSPPTQKDALNRNFVMGGQYQMNEFCDNQEHARGWEDPLTPTSGAGTPPGWLMQYEAQLTNTEGWGPYDSGTLSNGNPPQYHFPTFDLNAYYQTNDADDCTVATTNMDNTGVLPSLCGSLLDGYVNFYIPPVPTGGVPTLTVPDTTQVIMSDQRIVQEGTHSQVSQYVDYSDSVWATDDEDGDLLPECVPHSGQALNLGVTRVRCSVTDSDGNRVEDSFEVHVQYPFRFKNHLAGGEIGIKAGTNLKVKFTMDGDKGLDIVVGTPTIAHVDCANGEPLSAHERFTTGHNRMEYKKKKDEYRHDPLEYKKKKDDYRYDLLEYKEKKDEYTQIFRTRHSWKRECRRLSMTLVDDSVRTVDLRFR
ncbi:MAG: hypothetical protein MRJ67_05810 [Nitrospirales bacterium]|nr:hypothetical protein [Nitrospirales bacterium]